MYIYLWHTDVCHSGRGVPNQRMRRNNQAKQINRTVILNRTVIPDSVNAVDLFQSYGGHLTLFSDFGEDPLGDDAQKIPQREEQFKQHYVDFTQFFYTVVNGDYHLFRRGLLFFIELSSRLAR